MNKSMMSAKNIISEYTMTRMQGVLTHWSFLTLNVAFSPNHCTMKRHRQLRVQPDHFTYDLGIKKGTQRNGITWFKKQKQKKPVVRKNLKNMIC